METAEERAGKEETGKVEEKAEAEAAEEGPGIGLWAATDEICCFFSDSWISWSETTGKGAFLVVSHVVLVLFSTTGVGA